MICAPATGWVCSRRASKRSAGGQLEQPSEVKSSTTTGLAPGAVRGSTWASWPAAPGAPPAAARPEAIQRQASPSIANNAKPARNEIFIRPLTVVYTGSRLIGCVEGLELHHHTCGLLVSRAQDCHVYCSAQCPMAQPKE